MDGTLLATTYDGHSGFGGEVAEVFFVTITIVVCVSLTIVLFSRIISRPDRRRHNPFMAPGADDPAEIAVENVLAGYSPLFSVATCLCAAWAIWKLETYIDGYLADAFVAFPGEQVGFCLSVAMAGTVAGEAVHRRKLWFRGSHTNHVRTAVRRAERILTFAVAAYSFVLAFAMVSEYTTGRFQGVSTVLLSFASGFGLHLSTRAVVSRK